MVIVNDNVCVVSVLLLALIVLGNEGCINNAGCLVVNVEGEGISIGGVTLAVVPVELRGHNDLVTYVVAAEYRVVGIVYHGKVNRRSVRSYATAVMRLVAVVLGLVPYYLTGRSIDDLDLHFLCTTEKTCKYAVYAAYSVIVIGDCSMLLSSGDGVVLGLVHVVYVASERKNVVVVICTKRNSCIVVSFYLIIIVDRAVVSLGLYLVVVKVEDGCLAPVAVECKEGSVKINTVFIYVIKGKVTLNVHTVCKGRVEIVLICVGKSYGHSYYSVAACSYGNYTVRECAAGNLILAGGVKDVRHLCYVFGLGAGNALSHNDAAETVALRNV